MRNIFLLTSMVACLLFWVKFPYSHGVPVPWLVFFAAAGTFYSWVAGNIAADSWYQNKQRGWRDAVGLLFIMLAMPLVFAETIFGTIKNGFY